MEKREIREATIKHQSIANDRIDRVLGWASILHGGYQSFKGSEKGS